ncbi:uncharacterized protein CDV56_107313 [Aspergillus thermomutatus]|uniref:DUF7587 domain-containing protein n=1 Tax=Aspergillus thermomutatus TaxID=41047 RepID=A0A397HD57_ASPTH|nr:uncharacterized protein CDV56_107313 [Aspergillus thermomutatus]RHZ60739.1 hypothetical protein CDV56_107313 [Aspergillus thermomutatus]
MDNLTESMRNTHLEDGPGELEQLLFRPQADSGLAEKALDNIPRYLFRVVSPRSDGETNRIWARSESAYRKRSSSLEDIFFLLDKKKRTTIARTLNVHLRWWPKEGLEDNFVSWTSSLLFAIQYIYYRRLSSKDGSSLEDIQLYVIDTKRFPIGTFLRDLDLINAFREFDDHGKMNLENLQLLRTNYGYYFGEYLSQGSLKIKDKCQIVSAKVLFDDDRLHRIQPEFTKRSDILEKGKAEWANEVVRLRGIIWPVDKAKRLPTAEILDRLRAIGEIVANFEPEWRFALAIYFAALTGCESVTDDQETANDNVIFAYFRSESFNDTMPELKQVKRLAREIHKDFLLRQALDLTGASEANIRHLHTQNVFSDSGSAFTVTDSNEVLARAGETLLIRLRTVQMLCEEVARAISPDGA